MKKLNFNIIFLSLTAVIVSLLFIFNKTNSNEISVTGRCSKQVIKDKFTISISIKNLEKNSSIALSKTLSTYKQVSEYLKKLQSDNKDLEIETTEYSTKEKKEWNKKLEKNEKIGIESVISLKVITSNPDLLSNIAFDFGKFEDVFTSDFTNFVSDTLYKKETDNCLKEAMLNAKSQAELIASSLNQTVGKMTNVNYYSSNNNYTRGSLYKAAKLEMYDIAEESVEPASIFSGTTKIDVSVDVRFELK